MQRVAGDGSPSHIPHEPITTLANWMTGLRTLASMLLGIAAIHDGSRSLLVAAYLTYWVGDILDGVLARSLNQETRIGAVLDIISDRACTTIAALAFVTTNPEVVVPVAIFLIQFTVIDTMLSLSFLYWNVRGPNYFGEIDQRLYTINWSLPAKAVNTSAVIILCLIGWIWAASVVALVVTAVKVYGVVRLRAVMGNGLVAR
ncbi:MAG: CDP-alcohol phosphatidyltransferase family protein [Dermatophilaceae bacterium]